MNEYLAFRTAHGIDDKSYKDLYLGDYFKIQDGTYNTVWMVAHFDYYYNKGETNNRGPKGVVLISRDWVIQTKMNDTNSTVGGYMSTITNNTTCPAIATALSTVLGSYLISHEVILSNSVNDSIPSMGGANRMGASVSWVWTNTQCILPTEVQVYGTTVCSSSFYDVGESCEKLALFNFISEVQNELATIWLRAVSVSGSFCIYHGHGRADDYLAGGNCCINPLIYIG